MATAAKKNLPKRAPRIRGICAAAHALGRNRDHLRMVVQGKRKSPSLMRRYKEFLRGKAAAIKTAKAKS